MIVLVACVCLLLNVSLGVSINNVVPFLCNGCIPKPNECCVGTILSSRYIITSNFCAKMCQLVEIDKNIYQLNKYNVYPYAKTFVMSFHFVGPNTIALVNINMKLNQNTSFIKLASVDINSLIGSEAIIPDANKYRLAEIKHCGQDLSDLLGYYVCAREKDFVDCYIRQGTPLIINNTLIGIMGIQDSNNCEYSRRSFIAIKPIIYWINYTVDAQSYQKLFTLKIRHGQSNIVKHKTYSKHNTVSRKAKHKTNYKLTYFLRKGFKKSITPTKSRPTKKKTQMYARKNSISPTKSRLNKNKSQMKATKKLSGKDNEQNKKYKSMKQITKKSIKVSQKAFLIKNNKTSINKAIIKIVKPKLTIIRNKKQKDCSRLISDYIIITENLKTKTSTKKLSTKHFSSTTKANKYKPKKKSLPYPTTIKRKNIKSPKTNINFKNTSPTSKRKYPDKKSVKKIYKTTKFGTAEIKNEGRSLRLFSLTPSSLTLYEEPLILTKNNNNNATTIEMKQVTKPTNAYDWFKNAFKNMSNDPQPLLVLNMPTKTTEFIDLT